MSDKEYELRILLTKLEHTVRHHSNEVGLQTYGRKPHEMREIIRYTPYGYRESDSWKVQMSDRWMRNLRDECFKLIDEAKKLIEKDNK